MNEEKITPSGARILVLYDDAASFVANGLIYVPDTYRKQPLRGTTVAVGPGTKDEEMVVKVGDRVAFDWSCGTQVMFNDKVHLVIQQDDIMCILPDGE